MSSTEQTPAAEHIEHTPASPATTVTTKMRPGMFAMGACLWTLALIVGGLIVWREMADGDAPAQPTEGARFQLDENMQPEEVYVSDFELINQHGETVTNEDLQGTRWVVNFIFTLCQDTCPKITKEMSDLVDSVADEDVKFVSISVDPERDTPEQLKAFATAFGADPEQWMFLTGEKKEIYSLILDSFMVGVQEQPDKGFGYEFAHSNRFILVGEDGKIQAGFLGLDGADVALLRQILKGKAEIPDEKKFFRYVSKEGASTSNESISPGSPANKNGADANDEPAKQAPAWVMSLPAVNAGLNGLATLLLIAGGVLIKQGKKTAHRNVMLATFAVSVIFLACYLTYHFGRQYYLGEASKSFTGTGSIRIAYFTILITHVVLAAVVPVLAIMAIYHALRGNFEKHRPIAKVTFPIWLYVSITGVMIYFMLYHWPQAA